MEINDITELIIGMVIKRLKKGISSVVSLTTEITEKQRRENGVDVITKEYA